MWAVHFVLSMTKSYYFIHPPYLFHIHSTWHPVCHFFYYMAQLYIYMYSCMQRKVAAHSLKWNNKNKIIANVKLIGGCMKVDWLLQHLVGGLILFTRNVYLEAFLSIALLVVSTIYFSLLIVPVKFQSVRTKISSLGRKFKI